MLQLATAGNTRRPTLWVLQQRGFELRVELRGEDVFWQARKDGVFYEARNPMHLLGLCSLPSIPPQDSGLFEQMMSTARPSPSERDEED